ncbi:dnaJ homolog subfamily B member 9 [Embiotoca jacksoni]|uniref:dnaJ homolog subfamily B member 9 n=1 Tax=Embiotoca jacksoni TaxID=100190 RepID=UPI003704783E
MAAQGAPRWTQTCVVLLLCLPAALPAAPQPLGDYYDTLHVEPTATGGQIKKAFRKLAAKQHPDKNKSADAEKTFREIAEAYTVLSNQEKRRLYDSVGHKAFLNNEASAETEDDTNFHFSHFFHDFDASPFVKEQHVYWSFQEEHEEEEHYCFEEQHFHWSFQEEEEEL